MQTEDNLRLGMSREEARRAALLKFGGVESMITTDSLNSFQNPLYPSDLSY